MRAVPLFLALAACGATPRQEPAPTNATTVANATELADRELANRTHLDYSRPFRGEPAYRVSLEILLRACRAGDVAACRDSLRFTANLEDPSSSPALDMIAQSCRGGAMSSCRALPRNTAWPDLPGATSRGGCYAENSCDHRSLRAECEQGFAEACASLASDLRDDALLARYYELSKQDCLANIDIGCRHAKGIAVMQRDCTRSLQCLDLGYHALRAGNLIEARDAFERTCQFAHTSPVSRPCLQLATLYRTKQLPEPVEGRGQALYEWECTLARAEKRYEADCEAPRP